MAPRKQPTNKGALAPTNKGASAAPTTGPLIAEGEAASAPEVIEFPFKALEIISVPPHFWRAGRKFTQEATVIPLADLDDDEQALLRNEPHLRVRDIEVTLDDIDMDATLAQQDHEEKS